MLRAFSAPELQPRHVVVAGLLTEPLLRPQVSTAIRRTELQGPRKGFFESQGVFNWQALRPDYWRRHGHEEIHQAREQPDALTGRSFESFQA